MAIDFQAGGSPSLVFRREALSAIGKIVSQYGQDALLICDGFVDVHPTLLQDVQDQLLAEDLAVTVAYAYGATTDEAAHKVIANTKSQPFDCVVSLGAGRVIDTGKLVANDCPHIAVPTTAGTGAPMNGVIFGGEFAQDERRNRTLMPTHVVADPVFIDEMAKEDFAARALGVFMLLSESYVSARASIMSDATVWSGLEAFASGFLSGLEGDPDGREQVFYASLMAGIGTGQAGFGLVHRLANGLEQKTDLSYAQCCATIAAEVTDMQIQLLSERLPDHEAMDKYALIGELIAGRPFEDREEAYASLVGTLRRWIARLEIPKLALDQDDISYVIESALENWDDAVLPIGLSDREISDVILRRCARA